MARGEFWTAEQDETLKTLYALSGIQSLSASQIAAEMNCGFTRNAIIGRIHRLGLTLRGQRKPRPKQPRIRQMKAIRIGSRTMPISCEEIETAKLRSVEIEPRNLSLIELGPDECVYPYGEGPFVFCGHTKADGCSYCFPHHALTRKQGRTIDEAVTEARRRRMRGINFRRALLEAAP
jgi:GcrA cell cycle regulator